MSEFDSAAALSKSPPKSLAAFFAAGAERARLWRPEELTAIFRHQMSAPILVDLGGFDPATAVRLKTLSDAQSLLLKSFSDLFHHPVPPLELLSLTKDFAKANMDHPDSSLPREIAAALYYASIATAIVRLDARISQLKDDELQRGLRWAKDQPWVDDQIRETLVEALRKNIARRFGERLSTMNQDESNETPFIPPVSAFTGPIAELVGHRLLSPPTRPGLLASLAHFEVVRVLGGGGMGVVVLARDSGKGNDVAIKLIKPELVSDQRMVHRFVKEAGHLQKLKHPSVVPVLEVSDRPEGPYFVMPYFEQGSLAHCIRPGQPMEADSILDIARQVADGLGFAHRHGIIHRDLKPANILLGAGGKSCLADFGLARTMFNDTIVNVEGTQMEGTAPYMSPAVAAGDAEDTRCDIYAFGALLYEMLTGEPPYAGRNTNDIRKQILAGPPKPIRARNPAADAGLAAVAEGAMARELRDRYADMADISADLDRVKAGKTTVGPHGISLRVKKLPSSFWIPAGLVMIALGLWLLWSGMSSKEPAKGPATNSLATSAPPQISTNRVVTPLNPVPTVLPQSQWQVSILAGQPGASGSADGAPSDARFQSPGGIAVDTDGNVYVADTGNNTIRRIARGGPVSTLAGLAGKPGREDGSGSSARFLAPLGIAVDRAGNLYVAEFASDTIRKITPAGGVSTLAGSAGIPGGTDGTGDNAHFRNPWSVAVDSTGNVYVADKSNFTIRQITPTGRVSTFAGFPGIFGSTDGPGSYARFRDPHGVAVDAAGNVYVADTGNNTIRKISSFGMVGTLAGMAGRFGDADGTGNKARFSNIQSVAVDEAGNIYVLDGGVIRRITPTGIVSTLPRFGLQPSASGVSFHPTSIAVDARGNLYLVDVMNNVIWAATPPNG